MDMIKRETVKEFLKGTRNKYLVEISFGSDSIAFSGTYEEFKKSGKEYFDYLVLSWDVAEYEDGTLSIGILI